MWLHAQQPDSLIFSIMRIGMKENCTTEAEFFGKKKTQKLKLLQLYWIVEADTSNRCRLSCLYYSVSKFWLLHG
jgi:hypothetical protein